MAPAPSGAEVLKKDRRLIFCSMLDMAQSPVALINFVLPGGYRKQFIISRNFHPPAAGAWAETVAIQMANGRRRRNKRKQGTKPWRIV